MATIDVHHHFCPASRDNEGRPWSVDMTIDQLDRNGITTAIGTLPPTPDAGTADGPAQAADVPGRSPLGLRAVLL